MNAPASRLSPAAAVISDDPMKVWAVVQTHAGKERLAKYHLQKQHFDVYLPMRLTRGRDGHGGAIPFFPRYLFVTVTARVQRWQSIFSTIGVARVFTSNERLVGVRDAFIEAIRAQEIEGLLKAGVGVQVECRFSEGDSVLWGAVEAVFKERIDDRRALVLVNLLGRESPVTVDLTKLDASEPGGTTRTLAQHRRSA